MPPKITISRQQAMDAAFSLVQRGGLSALSARSLARELGCSTRPIYRAFESMHELEQEVIERAGALLLEYVIGSPDANAPPHERAFLEMGIGHLKFAAEQPELHKILFLSGRLSPELAFVSDAVLLTQMRRDPSLASLDDEALKRINLKMLLMTLGLTALVSSDSLGTVDDELPELLAEVGSAILAWERGGQSG